MSKYQALWNYVEQRGKEELVLRFEEIHIADWIEIDHSFLNAKKELLVYGYQVGKISLKQKTVTFLKTDQQAS